MYSIRTMLLYHNFIKIFTFFINTNETKMSKNMKYQHKTRQINNKRQIGPINEQRYMILEYENTQQQHIEEATIRHYFI